MDSITPRSNFCMSAPSAARIFGFVFVVAVAGLLVIIETPIVILGRWLGMAFGRSLGVLAFSFASGGCFAFLHMRNWFKHVAPRLPVVERVSSGQWQTEATEMALTAEAKWAFRAVVKLVFFSSGPFVACLIVNCPHGWIFSMAVFNFVAIVASAVIATLVLANLDHPDGKVTCRYWLEFWTRRSAPEVVGNEIGDALEELAVLQQSGVPSVYVYRRVHAWWWVILRANGRAVRLFRKAHKGQPFMVPEWWAGQTPEWKSRRKTQAPQAEVEAKEKL